MHSKNKFRKFVSMLFIAAILLSSFQNPVVSAQGNDGLKRNVNAESGKVSFIGPESGRALPAAKALGLFARPQDPALALARRFAPEFGIQHPDRELTELKENKTEAGRVTVRYQQKYQGIPVMGGELIVNTNERGDLYSMSGEVSAGLALPTQPKIDSITATQTALQLIAKWYQKSPADFVTSTPELWIYDESLLRPSTRPAELVWRMEVTAKDTAMPVRELMLVNAERGNIRLHFNQIDTAWDSAQKTRPDKEPAQDFNSDHSFTASTPEQPTESFSIEQVPALTSGNWYVATTGNDANDCATTSTPCATINGAIGKAINGEMIFVATGTYTGTGAEVVLVNKNVTLLGGWDSTFTSQNGYATIDGQNARRGVSVSSGVIASLEHFIIKNGSGTPGGGVYSAGNLTITHSSIQNNSASWGGGIYQYYGSLTLHNINISNNSASGAGGGMYNSGNSALNNTTISNNSASSGGGGIYNSSNNLALNNTTISNNSASSGGGIVTYGGSISNSIVGENTALISGPDCLGTFTSSGNNLISNTSGCTITAVGGDQLNVDPMLDPFLPEQGYQPLRPDSPAIDAGNPATCLPTDQRGAARVSTCDSGAYEYTVPGSATSLSVLSGNEQHTAPLLAFSKPLQVVVLDSQGSPVSNVNVTFTSPAGGASGTFTNSGTNITSVLTDEGGIATTSTFTANAEVGVYQVSASASGLASIHFSLKNFAWYVSPSGDDANSCSLPSSPCLTINSAINKAAGGDTILIGTGTYFNSGSQVVLVNKSVTLLGGWDTTFSFQNDYSSVDGQNARRGILVNGNSVVASFDRFIVKNGSSDNGGGVYSAGNLTITHSFIQNNSASSYGGGISQYYGNLTLHHSTISNNSASSSGGGIYNDHGNSVLHNSTISNNSASSGGGIFQYSGNLALNNTTISNNFASASNNSFSSGGGIYNSYAGLALNNTTISNNSASGSGGGIFTYVPANDISNSIVGENTALISGPDCSGTFTSSGNNIISNTSGCTITAASGDQFNVDPMLDTFLPAPGYQPLKAGSPAIDTGNPGSCLPTDQRSVARVGTCDIGAYEYMVPGSAVRLIIVSGDGQHTIPNHAFSEPLAVVAVDSQGSPVPNLSVTFIAPDGGASGTFADTSTRITAVTTNASGIATTSTLTANDQIGTYTVIVSASGVEATNFNLANRAWYVSPAGNDSNSCSTPVFPCLTINGAISKAGSGDDIAVAIGTYTGSGNEGVLINKSIALSGGWSTDFSTQSGMSTIDGQNARRVVYLNNISAIVSIDHFIIANGHVSLTYGQGGGIYNTGSLMLNNTTIINNSTPAPGSDGGGIYNVGKLTVNNTTMSKNSASSTGGGISSMGGSLTINNSTIIDNFAWEGGGIYTTNSTVMMKNTILAHNSSSGLSPNCAGTVRSLGHNLIGNNNGCSFLATMGDLVGTQAGPINTQSGPYTQGYYTLLPNSPAINAGNPVTCLAADQRGVPRPQGSACDIGAFEYGQNGVTPAYIFSYEATPQMIVKGNAASILLKAIVLDADGDIVPGVPVTFTAPASGASVLFTSTGTNISTASTDANGIATSSAFSANTISGGYTIQAMVGGAMGVARFQIANIGIGQVWTYTTNNTSALPGSFLCNQSTPSCTNGINLHADAAHKHATGTFNLYAAKHLRDSINNAGMTIISTVHYQSGYQNAFWNGSQMVYGDGFGFPLADDVVAHELTHGVTQYESNLFYYYQSGAINESFSDIWGEYYDQTNSTGNDSTNMRWLVGEDVSGLGAVRSMSDPTVYGDPDRMYSPYYNVGISDNGGVHSNSGVNNKAAYLLVEGGNFEGYSIRSLGWDKTAAIYYEANSNLLTSGSDYSDLYYALQQACTNLIGQKGIIEEDCAQVKNAVNAVNMDRQPAYNQNYNTDAPLCASNLSPENILYDDLEGGLGNWSLYARWGLNSSSYGPYAHSGNNYLYADDSPATITDATAYLSPVTIPANAYLIFHHAYDFEAFHYAYNDYYYDGGVLEYSASGGANWLDAGSLMDYNGYDAVIYPDWNNPLKGRTGFAEVSHGYISTRLNLASLAGQTVAFRWRMGLDDSGYSGGWWLDDVQIFRCKPGILGNVGAPGVALSYTDGTPKVVYSDAHGNYSLPVSSGWSGTVTPSLAGMTFTPPNRSYPNVTANQVDQDYDAFVILSGNSGVAGATMNYTGGSTVAVASGNYSITVPYGWSGTVTPSRTGFSFVPASKTYSNLTANQSNQNYLASWVGGITIISDQNVVAVGRPHIGNEVASYSGFTNGSLAAYVPMLFKGAFGSYDSALYVQNVHASNTANITIQYYDSNGVLNCTKTDTLASFSSKGYWLPAVTCDSGSLPAGWVGGVVVTSDQPIVAVGRPHVGSEVMTYNGFASGSLSSYIPMLFKGAFGGSYNAAFYVQNTHASNTASITIQYYDSNGVLNCTKTDTIAALASKGYWVPAATCDSGSLPAGWVGGVVVTSDQPIVAVGRPHIGTQVTTYTGFPSGSSSAYVPMLFKTAFGSYDSAFYVQNVHETNAASITLKYYDSAGNLNCTKTDTIAALASKGYWVPAAACDTGSLPTGWVGGVVVTSDQPIVAVGRPHIGAQVTTYNGFPSGTANTYLPMLFRDGFGGTYDSALYLQNLETSTTANLTIKLYDASGNLACTVNDTLAALASKGYWLPSLTCNP